MADSTGVGIAIPLDDGRTVVALPKSGVRFAADSGRDIVLSAADADMDTSGHVESTDVLVDVEGHAMVLRLPTPADAAAVRTALVAGAITATIVAAGAVAAMQGAQPQAGPGINTPEKPAQVQDFNRHGPRAE